MPIETFKYIAIDPGNNLGVAIYTISLPDMKIVDIETTTIKLELFVPKDTTNVLQSKLLFLYAYIEKLYHIHQPTIIFLEAAFMNIRFPRAVMQLSSFISVIELGFKSGDKHIKILRYPPKYIKKHIGAGGNAKKDDMTKALNKHNELKDIVNTSNLSEHAIDAIAIGYAGLNTIRNNQHILYTR